MAARTFTSGTGTPAKTLAKEMSLDYKKELVKALEELSLVQEEKEKLSAALARMEENKLKNYNAYFVRIFRRIGNS